MNSRIEKIKEKVGKINVQELVKTGKNIFDEYYSEDYEESIKSGEFMLKEIYTCYTSSDKLVLECLMQERHIDRSEDPSIHDQYFKQTRDIVYIKGKEIKELRIDDYMKENEKNTFEEIEKVIESANKKSVMQKQYIRNFFRRIFRGRDNNLLEGEHTNLSSDEVSNILDLLTQEKDKNFIDKYSKEKTETDQIIDDIQQVKDEVIKDNKEENQR